MKTMILIPALAPGAELIDYLQALSDAQLGQLVVVDDGSGPDYAPIFALAAQIPGCTVLRHEQNRGKGDALKTGCAIFRSCRTAASITVSSPPTPTGSTALPM